MQVSSLEETLAALRAGREQPDEPAAGTCCSRWAIRACRRACWRRACGNRWTYAGDGVAPGQLPASRLLAGLPVPPHRRRRRALRASSATRSSIRGRRSCTTPASRALGLNAVYLPLEARDAADFVTFARATGTARREHHGAVQDRADAARRRDRPARATRGRDQHASPCATAAGLAPTPTSRVFSRRSLQRIALEGPRVSVLGSGGAARAVAVALASRQAKVTVCGAQRMKTRARLPPWLAARPVSFRRRRRAGTCWSTPRRSAARRRRARRWGTRRSTARSCSTWSTRQPTPSCCADARAAGCQTIGGIEMLIAQAERQFELWTGQRPPAGLFEAAATGSGDMAATRADDRGQARADE